MKTPSVMVYDLDVCTTPHVPAVLLHEPMRFSTITQQLLICLSSHYMFAWTFRWDEQTGTVVDEESPGPRTEQAVSRHREWCNSHVWWWCHDYQIPSIIIWFLHSNLPHLPMVRIPICHSHVCKFLHKAASWALSGVRGPVLFPLTKAVENLRSTRALRESSVPWAISWEWHLLPFHGFWGFPSILYNYKKRLGGFLVTPRLCDVSSGSDRKHVI